MSDTKNLLSRVKEKVAHSVKAANTEDAIADPRAPSWIKYVAMLTGVLAALTGFLTVRATTLTNEAIYESNQAILSQTEASDAWSEYQADSIKARIVETQLLASSTLTPKEREMLTAEDADLRSRQPKSKEAAGDKLHERQAHLSEGLKRLQQKDMLGYAGMAAQIGIALASVAALLHRRIAFDVGVAMGILAVLITAYVMLSAFLIHA